MEWTRRALLGSGALGASTMLLPATARARSLGSNEDVRIAVVGLRGRGRNHIDGFRRLPGVRVVALCDVDSKVLAQSIERFVKMGAKTGDESKPRGYTDVRKLLEADDIDAITIATPNHWHSLMAIWACQAGKDCYVEKPVSHNVLEGRLLVQHAQKSGRVVAAGTQCRSNKGIQDAMRFVHEGGIGDVVLSRGLCYKRRESIGQQGGVREVPEHIDYELWTGPADLVPLRRKRLHYDWHWVWNSGDGDLGNQGIHQMDLCRWALGEKGMPKTARSFGARVGYVDDGETPNTQVVVLEYESAPLVFEVRGLPSGRPGKKGAKGKASKSPMDRYHGASIGCVIHGTRGELQITSYTRARAVDKDGKVLREFQGGGDHFANFVGAVRARKTSALTGTIEDGHISSALCHLGNASLRASERVSIDALRGALPATDVYEDCLARVEAHWRANGLELGELQVHAGAPLEIDAETERFESEAPGARAMLWRPGRGAFELPEA